MKRSVVELATTAGKVYAALATGLDGQFQVLGVDETAFKVILGTPRQGWSWGTRLTVAVVRLKKGTRVVIEAERRVSWNLTPDSKDALARLVTAIQARFPAAPQQATAPSSGES